MKYISWNVNGIIACIKKGFIDFINHEKPDIICIQETKANKEQVELNIILLGDQANFLQDGMNISIESYEGSVIGVSLPAHVVLKVVETAPVLKGQTAAASYKPALLENGVRSSVPPFVGIGDKIVVATYDGSYVKRADA